MEKIRKQQLIEATRDSIEQHGLQGTTITTIAKIAGVSTGIISHYFGGKSELLHSTVTYLLGLLHNEFKDTLAQTSNAKFARIDAIIDANLSDIHGSSRIATAWLCFWAQSRHSDALFALQKINSKRLVSNLTFSIKQFTSREDALRISHIMAAQFDGVWLRCALDNADLQSFRQAAQECKSLVRLLVKQVT